MVNFLDKIEGRRIRIALVGCGRISGGQRQRIGIARALYKQSSVLVFDEASSALDHTTEHAVMQAFNDLSPELTVIMIAHRLTTLRGCDRVIELSAGRIKRVITGQQAAASLGQL